VNTSRSNFTDEANWSRGEPRRRRHLEVQSAANCDVIARGLVTYHSLAVTYHPFSLFDTQVAAQRRLTLDRMVGPPDSTVAEASIVAEAFKPNRNVDSG
jgi:hypothetical protein